MSTVFSFPLFELIFVRIYTSTADNFARMYGSDGAFFCFFMQYHTIERFSKEKYVKIVY